MIGLDPEPLHPSYLELDRLFLLTRGAAAGSRTGGELDAEALQSGDAPLRTAAHHLRGCVQCQDYLCSLQQRAAAPVPAWVSALSTKRPSLWQRFLQALPPQLLFPVAATAAAGLALIVATHDKPGSAGGSTETIPVQSSPAGDQLRPKGGPSVVVFIKRGEKVTQWDGRTKLRAQDRLRLQVAAAGYSQVTVALQQPGGAQVLYSGDLTASAPTALPVSWEVSAQGQSEVLAVILSPQRLAEASPSRPLDLAALRHRRELWVTELVMEKEEAR